MIGIIWYGLDQDAQDKLANPTILMMAADDFRNWRQDNPDTVNLICFLPLSVLIELSYRQFFCSGFNLVELKIGATVFPKSYSLECNPLTSHEIFWLTNSLAQRALVHQLPRAKQEYQKDCLVHQ